MVEVFKTNVSHRSDADILLHELKSEFPEYRANFDLEDCDRILRVEGADAIDVKAVMDIAENIGFRTEVLLDILPQ